MKLKRALKPFRAVPQNGYRDVDDMKLEPCPQGSDYLPWLFFGAIVLTAAVF
jgi:hypothetical protein